MYDVNKCWKTDFSVDSCD